MWIRRKCDRLPVYVLFSHNFSNNIKINDNIPPSNTNTSTIFFFSPCFYIWSLHSITLFRVRSITILISFFLYSTTFLIHMADEGFTVHITKLCFSSAFSWQLQCNFIPPIQMRTSRVNRNMLFARDLTLIPFTCSSAFNGHSFNSTTRCTLAKLRCLWQSITHYI